MDVEQFANPTWPQRTPGLRRRLIRAAAKDLLILAVLLAAGEVGVRVLFPEYSRYIFTRTLTGGHPHAMNSWGVRDREFPRQCPPGETRLLCLGNSTTRGAGVASEHTYPKQLQALLNDRQSGDPYLVINAGGEAWSLFNTVDFLEKDGLDLGPSVVVLGFSPSMLAVLADEQVDRVAAEQAGPDRYKPSLRRRLDKACRQAVKRLKSLRRHSYLNVFVETNVRKLFYRTRILRGKMDRTTGAVFAYAFDVPGVDIEKVEMAFGLLNTCLRDIKAVLDQREVPFLVMGLPCQWEISDYPCDNRRHLDPTKARISPVDRAAEYCHEMGIPFVDLRPRLQMERAAMLEGTSPFNPIYNALDYVHLNAYGLRVAAEELLAEIDGRNWLARSENPASTGPEGVGGTHSVGVAQ